MPRSKDRPASVFISYRRDGGVYLARHILEHLESQGFDVFMDLQALGAGQFETETLAQIRQRDFFVMVLTKGSLTRMRHQDDWLRKELSTALTARRTIVPVLDTDFRFDSDEVRQDLSAVPEELRAVESYNAVRMPQPEYFESGLQRLIAFLKTAPATAAPPPPAPTGKLAEARRQLRSAEIPSTDSLTPAERTSPSWHELQQRLVGGKGSRPSTTGQSSLITAPRLSKTLFGSGLTWTATAGAEQYVLEWDADPEFGHPTVAYSGDRTSYFLFPGTGTQTRHYRVRATIGNPPRRHSAWSNIVALEPGTSKVLVGLGPPELTRTLGGVTWTPVESADEYVLQKSSDPLFVDPQEVYRGSETQSVTWMLETSFPWDGAQTVYYRVNARRTSPAVTGPWSEVLAVQRSPAAAPKLKAPQLTALLFSLSWTEVPSADEYVVEKADDPGFESAVVVYRGDKTSAGPFFSYPLAGKAPYRVKALKTSKPASESPWSNIVEL